MRTNKELQELEEYEERQKMKTQKIDKLECAWCLRLNKDIGIGEKEINPAITDEHYYQCAYHGTIFCDSCAHNFNKAEIKAHLAPKCKFAFPPKKPFETDKEYSARLGKEYRQFIKHKDCIYEKKLIQIKEI